MELRVILAVWILILNPWIVESANILVLMSVPSPSHFIWIRPIVNRLAEKGHNVTVLSVNVDLQSPPNVTYLHLEQTYYVLYGNGTATNNNIMHRSEENPFEATLSAYKFGTLACIGATTSNGFQSLLSYSDDFKFDLVIYDISVGPCVLGFLHKFRYPPLVGVTAFGIPPFTHHIVGGFKHSSHVPHFSLTYGSKMSFLERACNFLVMNFDLVYRKAVWLPRIQNMAQKAYDFELPDLAKLEERTQILLTNTNPAISHTELLPESVIHVGGLQIVEPKPLPKDVEEFIENGKAGAVLFAMGTNFKSRMFTRERLSMFVKVFSTLPEYNFLWKFDEDDLPMKAPSNLMVRKWLPQSDILAHPKTKAFITHCGLLGTFESTYYGVPIVAIPIYIDQHKNAAQSVRAGVGLALDVKTLSTESIRGTLLQVLKNDTFRVNMRKRSNLLRDQPEKPLDRAIWWIEWVLRHPNDDHLRSPMLDQGLLAQNNIDVAILVICTVMISVFLMFKCFGLLIKYNYYHHINSNNKKMN